MPEHSLKLLCPHFHDRPVLKRRLSAFGAFACEEAQTVPTIPHNQIMQAIIPHDQIMQTIIPHDQIMQAIIPHDQIIQEEIVSAGATYRKQTCTPVPVMPRYNTYYSA